MEVDIGIESQRDHKRRIKVQQKQQNADSCLQTTTAGLHLWIHVQFFFQH